MGKRLLVQGGAGAAERTRLDGAECLEPRFQVGEYFLRPAPVPVGSVFGLLMGCQHLALRRDDPQALILGFLLLDGEARDAAGDFFRSDRRSPIRARRLPFGMTPSLPA